MDTLANYLQGRLGGMVGIDRATLDKLIAPDIPPLSDDFVKVRTL